MSKITPIFDDLVARARTTGRDQRRDLRNGARLSVRHDGDTITLTISRPGALVGDKELATFRADCDVPTHARRIPPQDQRTLVRGGVTWRLVAFSWSAPAEVEEPSLFDEEPPVEFDDDQIVADAARAVEEGGYGHEENAL